MFNKYKQEIETWLRSTIRDEVAVAVSSIDTSLNAERTAFYNHIMAASGAINTALYRLYELSHFKENAELREHIKDLNSHIAGLADIVKKLHPTLKV